MGTHDELAKFHFDNTIPFKEDVVKRTIKAMIGQDRPESVLGLLNYNTTKTKWGVFPTIPSSNDTFGSYSFGQVKSSFAITVKKEDENSTHIAIDVSVRPGLATNGVPYLQSECDKFTKALAYYLEHQDEVDVWERDFKPKQLEMASKSGCSVFISLIIGGGALLAWLF